MPAPDTDWMSNIESTLQRLADNADRTHERLQRGDERMGRIEEGLQRNTEVTEQVRDWLTAGRVVRTVGSGVGSFAGLVAKLAAAGAAVAGLLHITGGKPPPGP